MLIASENDDKALLDAEDRAIIAAEHAPKTVDGETVQAVVGTPLADLITLLGEPDATPPTPNAQS